MKIDFFGTDNGMDVRAIKSGVYRVELIKDGKKTICLYIGESVWIASRCGKHIYSLYEDPAYFGLKPEDLENDQFTMRFSVLDEIKSTKSELGAGSYKEQELNAIKIYKPITQLNTSDRQIRKADKIKKVQEALILNGYKNK